MQVGDGGRVTDYAYKPDEPATTTATNEVFVFTPGATLDRLEGLNADLGEDGLEDLGSHLLPAQTRDGLARAYRLEGYWRDVGTVPAYWQAHRDFLAAEPADRPRRPGLAGAHPRWPAQRRPAAARAPWSTRAWSPAARGWPGRCAARCLAPGVVVEKGATVVDSVLLPGVRVRAGATVEPPVLDDGVESGSRPPSAATATSRWSGRPRRLDAGAQLAAGARLPEPEDD